MTQSELIGRGIQCKFKIDLIRFFGGRFQSGRANFDRGTLSDPATNLRFTLRLKLDFNFNSFKRDSFNGSQMVSDPNKS